MTMKKNNNNNNNNNTATSSTATITIITKATKISSNLFPAGDKGSVRIIIA